MESTKVIFRTFKKGGEVIAMFPETPGGVSGFTCSSYMQVGQHGDAWAGAIPGTRPSTPEEKAPIMRELERIGYKLTEVRKFSRFMELRRMEAAKI
jgi:hypothetical protein